MKRYYKVIEFLKTRISPKNIDWQRIDRTVQEVKESIHAYYERLLKAFKEYSGKEAIEPKGMLHFVFSDEIELKQKKLKEKAMVMQIKTAQTVVQGAFVQQMLQLQGNVMFQPEMRGRGCGGNMILGPDLNTVVVQSDVQGMKKFLPCHICWAVGPWKQECLMMVQEGVVQQNNDINAFQTMRGPRLRREAIWQQIVDKINSVAEVRRTVIECKKRWHDCKRRTKEKMARNRKAAPQTGGGSPAHQEALDHMEEVVAAVIPEEILTGIQGQDSADYQETTHMQDLQKHMQNGVSDTFCDSLWGRKDPPHYY
ncbi:hypothetical protein NDU88_005581 [Pleurodeles waltl]|uniref:Myb/SANT-like DNA-binding domain-containing protein n=1 Tax=Pleurodeles waltl TaxID=8319 RepID=A0AAV7X124_PLEWA|nr:hypothetical protein NDU88_005581 [Pleurodeles waltl]